MIDTETRLAFKEWVVLELMGHRRLAGLLTEQEIAGSSFLRLEIPGGRYDIEGTEIGGTTQFYSPAAVYCTGCDGSGDRFGRWRRGSSTSSTASRWPLTSRWLGGIAERGSLIEAIQSRRNQLASVARSTTTTFGAGCAMTSQRIGRMQWPSTRQSVTRAPSLKARSTYTHPVSP